MVSDFGFNDTEMQEGFLVRRSTATTEYLKECMGTALLELMREKPLEKISIEEMTARADVGRSTYFRYFKSKEEVLSFKICCLWKRFDEEKHISAYSGTDDPVAARLFLEFCLSLRDISDLLYATGHQNCILDAYLQILRPAEGDGGLLAYYHSSMTAYALFGLVNAWILRGYQESPEEMERIVRDWLKDAGGKE